MLMNKNVVRCHRRPRVSLSNIDLFHLFWWKMRLYRRMRRVEKGILSVFNWSAVAAHTQNSYKQNAELSKSRNFPGRRASRVITHFPAAPPSCSATWRCPYWPHLLPGPISLLCLRSHPYYLYYLLHVLMDWDRQHVQYVSDVPLAKGLQPIAIDVSHQDWGLPCSLLFRDASMLGNKDWDRRVCRPTLGSGSSGKSLLLLSLCLMLLLCLLISPLPSLWHTGSLTTTSDLRMSGPRLSLLTLHLPSPLRNSAFIREILQGGFLAKFHLKHIFIDEKKCFWTFSPVEIFLNQYIFAILMLKSWYLAKKTMYIFFSNKRWISERCFLAFILTWLQSLWCSVSLQ